MKRTRLKRKSKTPVALLRERADALCTPVAMKLHPKCELLCGRDTQVGHHYIRKAKSNALRYYIPNLIGLCNNCHGELHKWNETICSNRIRDIRGEDWWKDIYARKESYCKVDRFFYENGYRTLNEALQN